MPETTQMTKPSERGLYDNVSPADFRYWHEDAAELLSENGFTRYKLRVELALPRALHRRGLCSESVVADVEQACLAVETGQVYAEERRIKHDIRALVNLIREQVSDEVKPFVHMTATSYDIVDTANAARFKDVAGLVLLPVLTELEKTLIEIAEREAETVQVGRTHGQHAVPITFGFAMAGYVSRLGNCIKAIRSRADELVGKFSGAVGAYNASSLFFDDPEAFEAEVLAELGLAPAEHSTQIAPPEAMTRFLSEVVITAGVVANLARDMRNLQRTEIGEVGEEFSEDQVGSSTMPQKRNPINFENTESMWKIVLPRLQTVMMDQVSEHQRDLTNSASSRTYGEIVIYVVEMAKRMNRVMKKLRVDEGNLSRNFAAQKGLISAEPLYITLAALGHPDAHEAVRKLTLEAQASDRPLYEVAQVEPELQPFWERMTPRQKEVISMPASYTGIAAAKAKKVAERWRTELKL